MSDLGCCRVNKARVISPEHHIPLRPILGLLQIGIRAKVIENQGIPRVNAGELPEMDPYEEVAQQGQAPPLSPAYVPDPMKLDEHIPLYVLELEHPEYHVPSDDDIQDSIDYPDEPEDPEEDDDEDPEEDPSEEHEPENDDEDPEEDLNKEHKPQDEDTKKEEPSEGSDETKLFEEDETAVTPSPRHREARISVRPQTPMAASTQALIDAFAAGSPSFPLPPTSPAYDQAPLAETSAAAARAPRGQYDFVDTVGAGQGLIRSPGHDAHTIASRIMPVTRQGANDAMTPESIQAMIDRAIQRNSTHTQDDASQSSGGGLRRPVQPARVCSYTDFMKCQPLNFKGTEGVVGLSQWLEKMESVFHISGCAIDNQVKFATCTLLGAALTWWNGHVRTLGHDAAYAMTWGTLKKKLTDKYCPKGEIKKLEIELWNLRVRGNDVAAYTQRFQELALMCTKFLADETEKIDKYISGLPDNIHGNVMSARPKTLDDAIELANDLMDQKLRTYAERQNDNKRKADDSSRNNQQPHKKQNVARAYTAGPGEKKAYTGNLPLCTKCNYHHTRQCAPKCGNCKRYGHATNDCRVSTNNNNNNKNQKAGACYECSNTGHIKKNFLKLKNRGNNNGNGTAQGRAYALGGRDASLDFNIIMGTFLLNNRYATILFDTGADRSFVSNTFSALINITPTTLESHYD
ncbi:putative reverse transcriptase domain-containing protein, partial [Tanacetum coccineum]